jgi:ElaA protein
VKITFQHRPFDELSLRELHDIMWLRNEVFVVGQKITSEPEVDGLDPECTHVFGADEHGKIVAVTRLFLDADPVKVGRIAVDRELQATGIGTQMMHYVNDVLSDRPAVMSAQHHLCSWYTSVGWIAVGPVYDEAGIPHSKMVRGLA